MPTMEYANGVPQEKLARRTWLWPDFSTKQGMMQEASKSDR